MTHTTALTCALDATVERDRQQQSANIWLRDLHATKRRVLADIEHLAEVDLSGDPRHVAKELVPAWTRAAAAWKFTICFTGAPPDLPKSQPDHEVPIALMDMLLAGKAHADFVEELARAMATLSALGQLDRLKLYFSFLHDHVEELFAPEIGRAVWTLHAARGQARFRGEAELCRIPSDGEADTKSPAPGNAVAAADDKPIEDPLIAEVRERLHDPERQSRVVAVLRRLQACTDEWLSSAQLTAFGLPIETVAAAFVTGQWDDDVVGIGTPHREFRRTRVIKYVANKWTPHSPRR